jgi:hypothetical protein
MSPPPLAGNFCSAVAASLNHFDVCGGAFASGASP